MDKIDASEILLLNYYGKLAGDLSLVEQIELCETLEIEFRERLAQLRLKLGDHPPAGVDTLEESC